MRSYPPTFDEDVPIRKCTVTNMPIRVRGDEHLGNSFACRLCRSTVYEEEVSESCATIEACPDCVSTRLRNLINLERAVEKLLPVLNSIHKETAKIAAAVVMMGKRKD